METKNTALTAYELDLLDKLRILPMLDKSSQERIREKINHQRKESRAFEEAFLGSLAGESKAVRKDEGLLGGAMDALLHPVTAIKAKVGETLVKRRNKAPEILTVPHPVLSARAEAIDFTETPRDEIITIVRKLGAALRGVNHGQKLGMAAPQIGISKRIFVCQGAVCVNPSFRTPKVGKMVESVEGCYSVPDGSLYKVKRHERIFATFYSVDGERRDFKLRGLNAIVFQHELSHLDGQCCCDIGVLYTPEEHNRSTGQNIELDVVEPVNT